jgi:hypothetical protein
VINSESSFSPFRDQALKPGTAKGTFLIALVNCTTQADRLSADQASCQNN